MPAPDPVEPARAGATIARDPIVAGTLLAALAAVAFGLTTPLIQRFGNATGPFATAALLYLGAALGTLTLRRTNTETRPDRRHLSRLLLVALLGAAVAPSLFAWGLQRVTATAGALLQNGEAVFTVLLAALLHREHIGPRVAFAVALMFAGGALTITAAATTTSSLSGALAVSAAVVAWALDNVLSRPLSHLDPALVVRAKALLGVALTATIALLHRDALPHAAPALGLLACGATGYGLSLRLYLLAQRRVGAARTGSVFATAPFVGALAAITLGDRPAGLPTAIAAALFLAGLFLHLTEQHDHAHSHPALTHDHAHTHDDGHHHHHHDVYPTAAHSHPHHHPPVEHTHPHAPDLHHDHAH